MHFFTIFFLFNYLFFCSCFLYVFLLRCLGFRRNSRCNGQAATDTTVTFNSSMISSAILLRADRSIPGLWVVCIDHTHALFHICCCHWDSRRSFSSTCFFLRISSRNSSESCRWLWLLRGLSQSTPLSLRRWHEIPIKYSSQCHKWIVDSSLTTRDTWLDDRRVSMTLWWDLLRISDEYLGRYTLYQQQGQCSTLSNQNDNQQKDCEFLRWVVKIFTATTQSQSRTRHLNEDFTKSSDFKKTNAKKFSTIRSPSMSIK